MKKITVVFLFVQACFFSSYSGNKNTDTLLIKWYSFEEAVALNEKHPKKFLIDVYTDWCGWCKKMDASTFTDKEIIKKVNKYFYAVKLNAERKDSLIFQNTLFVNPEPNKRGSVHQLALSLLNGKLGYPTIVYLNEKYAMLSPIPGYQTPETLMPILMFFGENKQNETTYEEFLKTYNKK